jgi:cellulose biosynthesis protein BcsQ/tetratricopeptide (TPR) repeat protein
MADADTTQTGTTGGSIITFYSYKGGTGRTMAVANVAWILASAGKRVLAVDWDLESPGLHRYFHPFLFDKELRSSLGVIDLVRGYAQRTLAHGTDSDAARLMPHSELPEYVINLQWDFANGGTLDFMPAGQQVPVYSRAVNTFDWEAFYSGQQGSAFFRALIESLRERYDYVLVDSRTGINDVAGICTIELPDIVVNCFTMSTQSIKGAVAVAESIQKQRADRPIRILPVPMRVEYTETHKLDAGRDFARQQFAPFLVDRDAGEVDRYWGLMEIPYRPFFAYEEVLAPFGDRPRQENSVLAACERLVTELTSGEVRELTPIRERERRAWLAQFERVRDGKSYDMVITYASVNRMWAEWLAAQLSIGGKSTQLRAIDYSEGTNALHELRTLVGSAQRHVAVLSRDYAALPQAAALWRSTAGRPSDVERGRLVPVRIDGAHLPPPFTDHVSVDLVNASEEQAQALIKEAFDLPELEPDEDDPARRPRFPRIPPPTWHVPRRGTTFVGRGEALELLRERLATEVTVMLPQALYGLGGVGKTQMAIEYAHRFAAEYDLVWWIPAEQPNSARRGLLDLARTLQVPTGNTTEETLEHVRNNLRLGIPTSRWLLIFDNAEEPDQIRDLIPEGGHVLITSRNKDWIQYAPVVEVGTFDRTESVRLLLSEVDGLAAEEAEHVAAKLEDMPLALAQAATWLKLTGMSVEEYLERLDSALAEVLDENVVPGYGRTVAATWRISLERMRAERPASAALLELCSFFGSEPIPVAMLKGHAFAQFIAGYDAELMDRARTAIRYIGEYALARVDFGSNSIQMHRLVRAVIQAQIPADRREELLHHAQAILIAADPRAPDKPQSWPIYEELWPHVDAVGLHDLDTAAAREMLLHHARFLYRTKDFAASRQLASQVLKRWQPRYGSGDLTTLMMRFHLANALRAEGAYTDARTITADVLTRLRGHPNAGPSHPYTVLASGSRGADLRIVGRYQDAMQLDKQTVTLARQVFGEGAAETLRAMNNQAASMRLAGNFGSAAELMERVYQSRRQMWGPHDPDTLRAAATYGRDLLDIGRLDEALDILRSTFEAQSAVCRRGDPDTLRSARYTALAVWELGQFAEAHRLIQETATEYERVHVATHLDVLACRLIMASTYSAVGEHDEAIVIGRDVLSRYRAVLGPDHTFTIACENNLGIFLRKAGILGEAERLSVHVLARLRADLTALHPYALFAAVNRASDLAAHGWVNEALEMDQAAVDALVSVLGEDHPKTIGATLNLVLSRLAAAQNGAQEQLDAAVDRLRRRYGSQNPRAVDAQQHQRVSYYIEPPQT